MTSVVIIADSGAELARLTASVRTLRGAEIVRHANGRASVARLAARYSPSLVVVGEMTPRRLTFERIREVRSACPESTIVAIAAAAGARWLVEALQAGATAALPVETGPAALAALLEESLTTDRVGAAPAALAA
jgi:DNA-binding NarL/FixJ family response regulator